MFGANNGKCLNSNSLSENTTFVPATINIGEIQKQKQKRESALFVFVFAHGKPRPYFSFKR